MSNSGDADFLLRNCGSAYLFHIEQTMRWKLGIFTQRRKVRTIISLPKVDDEPVVGFILSAAFLPLVMTGLHQGLIPIHAELIKTTGVTVLLPILAMAGSGQVGAALAVW